MRVIDSALHGRIIGGLRQAAPDVVVRDRRVRGQFRPRGAAHRRQRDRHTQLL